jgi:hypothetical protein
MRACFLIVIGLVVVGALCACIGGVAYFASSLVAETNTIRTDVTLDVETVAVGQTITITAEVENVDLDAITIRAVGLESDLLDGAEVVSIDPSFRATEERSYPVVGDWTEYTLGRRIPGGEKFTITITLQATQPGFYSGDFSVWVDESVLGVDISRARHDKIEFEVQ